MYMNHNNLWEEKNLIEQKKSLENNPTSVQNDTIKETKSYVMKKEWKDIGRTNRKSKISGIYKIVNKINGKFYIGSSEDILDRWYKHQNLLNRKIHKNTKLQNAWIKYGADNFLFILVENIEKERLLEIEQNYLNECSEFPDNNYNINYYVNSIMRGRKHSIESRKKMSAAQKGKTQSIESKIKNANSNRGRKHSEETKEKMRKSSLGKSNDKTIYTFFNIKTKQEFVGTQLDFRDKIPNLHITGVSKIALEKWISYKNWILKKNINNLPIRKTTKGRIMSEEQKRKISLAFKLRRERLRYEDFIRSSN